MPGYLERLKQLAGCEKVIAIGEIGLDYHYDDTDKPSQKRIFEEQLLLAEELKLPVIIHSRDAVEDTIDILSRGTHTRCGALLLRFCRDGAGLFKSGILYWVHRACDLSECQKGTGSD